MRALQKFQLKNLRCFKELGEGENPVVHILANLEIGPVEGRKSAFEVGYSATNQGDAQTVLEALVRNYQSYLNEKSAAEIANHQKSLAELYEQIQSSIAEEKAKKEVSDSVIAGLEERLVAIMADQQSLKFYTSLTFQKRKVFDFTVLQEATEGELTRPILPRCLGIGAIGGFLVGITFLISRKIWRFIQRSSRE